MYVVRQLGIQYIWIDSLCIIQDSKEDSKSNIQVYTRSLLGFSGLSHVAAYSKAENPTYTRAWVLQQRILLPRILHFCAGEVAWECNTHIKCECTIVSREANQRTIRQLITQKFPENHCKENVWLGIVNK